MELTKTITAQIKKQNFSSMLWIVVCAALGYTLSAFIITSNIIQYSTQPEAVSMKVTDRRIPNKATILKFEVNSVLPVDTVKTKSLYGGKYIGEDMLLYHQNPSFLIWTMLICIMISIAAGSAPAFVGQIRELKKDFTLTPKQIRRGMTYAIVLALFLIATNGHLPGYYGPPDIMRDLNILFKSPNMPVAIVVITILLSLPAFAVVFLVGLCSDNIVLETKDAKDDDAKIYNIQVVETAAKKLKTLHKILQGVLQILAVIVVFSVLTSSALGQSIKATVELKGFDLYPKEASLVYGLYFSLFLCIIYIPVYFYIKQNYNRLKEMAVNLNPSDDIKEKPWYKDLLGDTRFEGTALDNLKLAFTLMAPLLTSFLPESLHLFK